MIEYNHINERTQHELMEELDSAQHGPRTHVRLLELHEVMAFQAVTLRVMKWLHGIGISPQYSGSWMTRGWSHRPHKTGSMSTWARWSCDEIEVTRDQIARLRDGQSDDQLIARWCIRTLRTEKIREACRQNNLRVSGGTWYVPRDVIAECSAGIDGDWRIMDFSEGH